MGLGSKVDKNRKGYDWAKLEKIRQHKQITPQVKERLLVEREKLKEKLIVIDNLLQKQVKVKENNREKYRNKR